jgi:hypothetical protein
MICPRPAERRDPPMTADQLRPPEPYRLYRATISQCWAPARETPASRVLCTAAPPTTGSL